MNEVVLCLHNKFTLKRLLRVYFSALRKASNNYRQHLIKFLESENISLGEILKTRRGLENRKRAKGLEV